jgi:hypothetical protein
MFAVLFGAKVWLARFRARASSIHMLRMIRYTHESRRVPSAHRCEDLSAFDCHLAQIIAIGAVTRQTAGKPPHLRQKPDQSFAELSRWQ